MKLKSKHRRRNKRAKGVRRLSGVVQALQIQLKSARARIESLGGHVDGATKEMDRLDRRTDTLEDKIISLNNRVGVLEKVPRLVRKLFGAA